MFRLGIERIGEYPRVFADKRLGMVVSPSGTDQELRLSADVLAQRYDLRALYGPEHGVRGAAAAGEAVEGAARDPVTGLPVYSLYRRDGQHLTEEMVQEVDALVYDVQDLGLRFYTYISTLVCVLEGCAKLGKELIVLDRPNPLGGLRTEGGVLRAGFESFVGCYDIPIRYAMTAGEFAGMVNAERDLGCRLTVIPMAGWRRELMFPDLGYPFLMPSPSIPHFSNALLYAGTCLFEGTNVSEGRGTADPFALIGAPFIDAEALCRRARERRWPGVLLTPAHFVPSAGKHAGTPCEGVHLHLTDAAAYAPVRVAVELMALIREGWPEAFAFNPPAQGESRPMIDLLSGGDEMRLGEDAQTLLSRWEAQSEAFCARARQYDQY